MSEFVRFLHEVFEEFGAINSRKMFGGYGIYHDGVMIGLVADDTLYLKADKTTEKYFIEKGQTPFEYDKGDKKVQMSYFLAPEEIFDASDEARHWANLAYEAALRSKSKK
jgi:DNA transformation protein and related proteins